jgi:hypothetical protein
MLPTLKRQIPQAALWGVGVLLAACAASRLDEGILQRNENYPLIFESGVVVAPVAYTGVLPAPGEAREFFTEQMATAFFAGWPGRSFVSSGELLHRMAAGGPAGRSQLEEFHAARIRGEPLTRELCASLNQLVMHRYLLLPWAEEKVESGMVDPDREYTDYTHADDVRRLRFEKVKGQLHGLIVDLWQAEVVWEGVAPYATDTLYGGLAVNAEELLVARDTGVVDFMLLLTAP